MRPLPFHWPYALVFWAVFIWAYIPEFRIVRSAQKAQTASDKKSLQAILFAGGAASLAAFFVAGVPALQAAAGLRVPMFVIGTGLVVLGSLLRRHCFRMLGASFTGDVRASKEQVIVTRGAYRWLRHPSYTAGIILFLGVGVALGSWVSAGLSVVGALLPYLYRMNVEEKALLAAIGEPYAAFMRTRKRLVPFLY